MRRAGGGDCRHHATWGDSVHLEVLGSLPEGAADPPGATNTASGAGFLNPVSPPPHPGTPPGFVHLGSGKETPLQRRREDSGLRSADSGSRAPENAPTSYPDSGKRRPICPSRRGLLNVRCTLRPARIADPQKGPFLGVLQPICHLLVRSECFRLEQQFAGRDSYPLG